MCVEISKLYHREEVVVKLSIPSLTMENLNEAKEQIDALQEAYEIMQELKE